MKNLRILQKPNTKGLKQRDWFIVTASEADFAFRVWGGSTVMDHLSVTDNIEQASSLSSASFLFIKSLKDHSKEVLSQLNKERMFSERVGGDQNPGGVIFRLDEVEKEYVQRCEELGFECDFVDLTIK